MKSNLKKIEEFIFEHHIFNLATISVSNEVDICSVFYVYDVKSKSFLFASDEKTEHIKNILKNNQVAGTIVLETKIISKIQGLQFKGDVVLVEDKDLKDKYFKSFPYAKLLNPKIWQLNINYMKFTNNRLGFGKKLIWEA